MAHFGSRLRGLREEKELSQEALGKVLNLSQSTIAYYELNRKQPTQENLQYFADFFNVSVDYLLGRTDIRNFDKIKDQIIPVGNTVKIPIIGTIRAGEPVLALQNIEGYMIVDEKFVKDGEFFYLRVNGNSMLGKSRIADGDLVLVRKQSCVENGDIAVVIVDGEDATLKRFYLKENMVVLQPDNPDYEPLIFGQEHLKSGYIQIVGLVKQLVVSF
jgi:repressor LexA